MSMKFPLTPAGIEPVTFRIVTQHLNHCATAVPITINVKYVLFCHVLIKSELSQMIFEKILQYQVGIRVFPCGRKEGQTDRHDEANRRFSQFCESV